jgi:hypothetical protein
MRIKFWLLLWAGLFATNLSAATIQFQVSNLGGTTFRFNYVPSGFAFQVNQDLDIRFNPALYGTLSNAVVGGGFSALLLQPDNPPGSFGDYIALALVNNPSLAGPFSVDVIFKGSGTPGVQPFVINQFDPSGNFVSTITSGLTTPLGGPASVPEPGSFSLGVLAMIVGGTLWTVRRRARQRCRLTNHRC